MHSPTNESETSKQSTKKHPIQEIVDDKADGGENESIDVGTTTNSQDMDVDDDESSQTAPKKCTYTISFGSKSVFDVNFDSEKVY